MDGSVSKRQQRGKTWRRGVAVGGVSVFLVLLLHVIVGGAEAGLGTVTLDGTVLPQHASPPWTLVGPDTVALTADGLFDFTRPASNHLYYRLDDNDLSSAQGTVLEFRARAVSTAGGTHPIAAAMDVRDGTSLAGVEVGVGFIRSLGQVISMDTTTAFHVYRVELQAGTQRLYVDGALVHSGSSEPYPYGKFLVLGQTSSDSGATRSLIDYYRYRHGIGSFEPACTPVLHLSFDEGQGTTAGDSSGNGNHGTIYGGAQFTTGQAGAGLRFDGGDDYVLVPDSNSLDVTQAITIDFWMNPSSYPGNAVRVIQRDVSPGGPSWSQVLFYGYPGFTGILMFRPVTDGASLSTFGSDRAPPQPMGSGDYVLSLNRWYHLTFTYDAPSHTSRIYVDGALISETLAMSGAIPLSNAPLLMGAAGHVTSPFHGALDEVKVFGAVCAPSPSPRTHQVSFAATGCSVDVPLPPTEVVEDGGTPIGEFSAVVESTAASVRCVFVSDDRGPVFSPSTVTATYVSQYLVDFSSVGCGVSPTVARDTPSEILTYFNPDNSGVFYSSLTRSVPRLPRFSLEFKVLIEDAAVPTDFGHSTIIGLKRDLPNASQFGREAADLGITLNYRSQTDDPRLSDGTPGVPVRLTSDGASSTNPPGYLKLNIVYDVTIRVAGNRAYLTVSDRGVLVHQDSMDYVREGEAYAVFQYVYDYYFDTNPAGPTRAIREANATLATFAGQSALRLDTGRTRVSFLADRLALGQYHFVKGWIDDLEVRVPGTPGPEWVSSGAVPQGEFPPVVQSVAGNTRCLYVSDDRGPVTAPTTVTATYRTQYSARYVTTGCSFTSWSSAPLLGTARWNPGVAVLPDGIHVVGGRSGGTDPDRHEVFDPTAGTWRDAPPLPTPRSAPAVATLNGRIHVVGGHGFDVGYTNVHEAFDPVTGAWTTLAPAPVARVGSSAAAMNGKLYIIGGADMNVAWAETHVYDPATNSWAAGPAPPAEIDFAATAVLDGKVYIFGGLANGANTDRSWLFDPSTGQWMEIARMPSPRRGLDTAPYSNGRFYVFGGWDGSRPVATVESYDPVTNSWRVETPMPTPRFGHVAASASEGRIFIIGGTDNVVPYNTVELFTYSPAPPADEWVDTGAIPTGAFPPLVYSADGGTRCLYVSDDRAPITAPTTVTATYKTQYLVRYVATGCVLQVAVPVDEWVDEGAVPKGQFLPVVTAQPGLGPSAVTLDGTVLPTSASPPWALEGYPASLAEGGFINYTRPGGVHAYYYLRDSTLDNSVGSTMDARVKVVSGSTDQTAAYFDIRDGTRGIGIAIRVGSIAEYGTVIPLDTTSDFRVYRLELQGSTGRVFVDGVQVWEGPAPGASDSWALFAAGTSSAEGPSSALFDYVSYAKGIVPTGAAGTRCLYLSDDRGPVTAPTTVTATYRTQHLVKYAAVGCTLSVALPAEEWVDAGSIATGTFPLSVYSADGGTRCLYLSDDRGAVTAPTTVTATYRTQHPVTYAATGCVLPVAVPSEEWVDVGAIPAGTFPLSAYSGDGRTRCLYVSDDRGLVTAPATVTATYRTQHLLAAVSIYGVEPADTLGIVGGQDLGSPSPGTLTSWFDEGSAAVATLENGIDSGLDPAVGFVGWAGDAAGLFLASDPIVMDAPRTATALWVSLGNFGDIRTVGFWMHNIGTWYKMELAKTDPRLKLNPGAAQVSEADLLDILCRIAQASSLPEFQGVAGPGCSRSPLETFDAAWRLIRTPNGPDAVRARAVQQLFASWLNLERGGYALATHLSGSLFSSFGLDDIATALSWGEAVLVGGALPDGTTGGGVADLGGVFDAINNGTLDSATNTLTGAG